MQTIAARQKHAADHEFSRSERFPFWTLFFVRRGWAPLRVGGVTLRLSSPFLVLARPGARYQVGDRAHARRWEESWVIFAPTARCEAWMRWPTILPGVMGMSAERGLAREIDRAFDQAQAAASTALSMRQDLTMNHLERILILAQGASHRGPGTRIDDRIRAVVDHIHLHLHEALSVADLAGRAHLSESHLAHEFRRQVGVAPKRFIEARRMHRAMDLLIATHRPVSQIAREVGFENAFHFSTRFRRCVGCSPRALRQAPGRRDACYARLMARDRLQK